MQLPKLLRNIKLPKDLNPFVKNFLTLGPLGFSPKAPGTVGSFAAFLMGLLLLSVGKSFLVLLSYIVLGAGIAGITYYYKTEKPDNDDPSYIIIDEVLGMWLVMAYVPFNLVPMILAFIFFRVFDILKPTPINMIESFFKGTPVYNAIGIMFDDVVAAIYAIVVVNVLWVFGFA